MDFQGQIQSPKPPSEWVRDTFGNINNKVLMQQSNPWKL